MSHVRRREFITLIGGAVALPFTARARQGERMRRIGVLMPEAENDPETPAWVAPFQQSLEKLGWSVATMLAHDPGGGLIFPPDPFLTAERKSIVELAARYRLPAIYPFQFFPADGGLVSYGVNIPAQFQQAAAYVDRILRGAEPSNLPVQQPTKLNLKTAKTLGLEI